MQTRENPVISAYENVTRPRMMDEFSVIGSGYDDHVEHARWTDDVGHKGCLIIKTTGSM